jgi:hypothetical protein
MAYLDYSPVQIADQSEGIRRLGDQLTDVVKMRAQRKQQEQQLQLQREQEERRVKQQQDNIDYQNRIIDQRENRDQRDFSQRQDERVANNRSAVAKAIADGNPQLAQQIAQGMVTYDPVTGKETGRGSLDQGPMRDVGPEPTVRPEPEMPAKEMGAAIPDILRSVPGMPPELAARLKGKVRPEPEAGALVGPIPSPEETRRAEIQRIAAEPASEEVPDVEGRIAGALAAGQSEEAKRKRYQTQFEAYREETPTIEPAMEAMDKFQADTDDRADEVRSFPQRQAQYAADRRSAEAERPFSLRYGEGPVTTLDVQSQRYSSRQAAAEDFLAALPPNLSDMDRQAAAVAHGNILAGQSPKDALAAFQKERLGIMTEGGRDKRAAGNNATSIEVAKIRAATPRGSSPTSVGNLDMRQFEQFQKDAERFSKRYGVPADINGLKQLNDGLRGIGGDNAALQRGVAFQIARSMQGVGPLTQQDIERIATDIAGKGGTLESFVQKATTGHLGESEKKVFFDAIRIRTEGLGQRMQVARDQAEAHFLADKSPYRAWVGDDFIVSELNAMFPGTKSPREQSTPARRGGPPEVNAKNKGKKLKATEDLLNQLGGK